MSHCSCECENRIRVKIKDLYKVGPAGAIGERLPNYNGSYTVTPNEQEQVLYTANKSLSQNIVVHAVETVQQGGTATGEDILTGKTAFVNGQEVQGQMADNGSVSKTIATKNQSVQIERGFHSGSGSVTIAPAEQQKIVPENIKAGINILGTVGSYAGEDAPVLPGNATASDILQGKTAYVYGQEVTGNIPVKGAVSETISDKSQRVTIERGYHDGNGGVELDPQEVQKLIPENIKQGVMLFGTEGTYTGAGNIRSQSKVVTPSNQNQVIVPDAGYDYLSQVTVEAIQAANVIDGATTRQSNAKGGTTVTIG